MTAQKYLDKNWKKYIAKDVHEIASHTKDISAKIAHLIEEMRDSYHTGRFGDYEFS